MQSDTTPHNEVIDEVVIACNPNAIPAEMRNQWVENGKQVYAAVLEVQETPDGYQFRLPSDSSMLLKIANYISNERLCCAFLHFTLEITPNSGPFWLRLAGGEGVKAYMRSVFEANSLLREHVAEAAGFRAA
ncbi:MAG: hypothetical protein ABI947_06565 [Chloroflexota bacterium]